MYLYMTRVAVSIAIRLARPVWLTDRRQKLDNQQQYCSSVYMQQARERLHACATEVLDMKL